MNTTDVKLPIPKRGGESTQLVNEHMKLLLHGHIQWDPDESSDQCVPALLYVH